MSARGKKLRLSKAQPSKSFLPRFFTKKRAGSRGGAHGRAPQRAERPHAQRSAGGGQRGNPRRGFPLCGRPPPPAAVARHRGAGGGRRKGSSGTPSPTGRARVFTLAGMSCTVLVYGIAKGRGPIPAPTSVYHAPHIEIKKRPSGAFSPFLRRGAPKLQSSAERTPQRPSGSSHASGRGGRVPKPHGGATTPSAFLWGSTPFLWARPKKWGGTGSTT